MVKSFILFLILFFSALFVMQDSYVFQKTRDGKSFEYFKSVSADQLPPILSKYLFENKVKYTVYKIPNFVVDYFTYNNDFTSVYKNKNKYSIIMLSTNEYMQKNSSYKMFYDKVQDLMKVYGKDFNTIIIENSYALNLNLTYDKKAYEALHEYCKEFCLIDPNKNTMFVFNRVSQTEVEALEVLFQQYSFSK